MMSGCGDPGGGGTAGDEDPELELELELEDELELDELDILQRMCSEITDAGSKFDPFIPMHPTPSTLPLSRFQFHPLYHRRT